MRCHGFAFNPTYGLFHYIILIKAVHQVKLSVTSLTILALLSINVGAQESSSRGLLAGARIRIGKGRIFEIKYSQDGTRLAVASSIGIWLYDTSSHQEMDLLAVHPTGVRSVAFSSDGRMLASGSSDGAVRLWDAKTGKQLQSLSGHARIVTSVAFSPDGRTLASGNSDGTVLLS